ncbi:hypothetical protein HPG02_00450 [Pediococcus pentosaceus]|uniref:hypothetical protein n=1 Tax=Pediococcus pentosaceus TaxID=1255 RepID=UPI001C1EB05C|nr:hypothetical protein [Pediococcus pentosaceus]MBU7002107.1 hypothetical protein [Pediococcus pentosaceus]MCG9227401.1 hypothetical protein [Pediococcus pentosaceus]MDA8037462.1 hypothetical protein [Pediococcus pentosaceus]
MTEKLLLLLGALLIYVASPAYYNTDFYLRNKISDLLDKQKKSYKDYHDLEKILLERQKLLGNRIEKLPIGSDKFFKTKKKLQANSDTREQIQEELIEIEKENKV